MKPRSLPYFREGIEYRQLHPTKEGGRNWRFVLLKGVRIPFETGLENVICYHGSEGRIWARHDRFGLFIEEGYAWNGCSPKRWIPILGWCGTPDFHCTRLASCAHDVGYQFAHTDHFPFNKSDVDALFYHTIAMQEEGDIATLFHKAVVKFGSWSNRIAKGEFSTLLL